MLGVLLAIKGSLHRPQLASGSSGSHGARQDKHMVLPMSPMVGRIPILPLSSKIAPNQPHKVISIISVNTFCRLSKNSWRPVVHSLANTSMAIPMLANPSVLIPPYLLIKRHLIVHCEEVVLY